MKNFNRIFKWAMVLLIVVSVVLLVLGFAAGWKEGNVDTLLTWTYIMVGLALGAVVIVGLIVGAANDPKSLVKLGIGLVCVAVVCFLAYLIAPGAPAMGMLQQPSAATLKLTDTILYLTYFAGIVAVLAIVVGEIRLAITNKKG
jgi:uncharacterized membrane protein